MEFPLLGPPVVTVNGEYIFNYVTLIQLLLGLLRFSWHVLLRHPLLQVQSPRRFGHLVYEVYVVFRGCYLFCTLPGEEPHWVGCSEVDNELDGDDAQQEGEGEDQNDHNGCLEDLLKGGECHVCRLMIKYKPRSHNHCPIIS